MRKVKAAKLPPKNQKTITQFFTNASQEAKETSKSHYSPEKYNIAAAKRKATSPVKSIEILDIQHLEKGTEDIERYDSNSMNTYKKQKYNSQNLPHKDVQLKHRISPQKENSFTVKNNVTKDQLSCDTDSTPNILDKNILERNNRSPLMSLSSNSIEEDIMRGNNENLDYKSNQTEIRSPKISLSDGYSPSKKNGTPMKNAIKEQSLSPGLTKLSTPKKEPKIELSPSKCGSTVKQIDFIEQDVDVFGNDWDLDDIEEDDTEDLDLGTIQRCEITSVKRQHTKVEVRLKNANNNRATCYIEGIWLDTPLYEGDTISILASRDASGHFTVGNSSGLLVLRPDHLISSTSVVAGVFCRRKAVLQERWKGIDSANTAMTIGILIHELVQKALTQNIMDVPQLRSETEKLIKDSIQMLYDAGLTEEETRSNMDMYILPLAEFMQMYLGKTHAPTVKAEPKDKWNGHIDKVLDIEENICCPQLGLKGKIDATLEVTIHERKGRQRAIVPLELKSGKASMSAEHRGQLVMYGMMLSLQQNGDPTRDLQRGLLLYLRDRVDLKEVSCGYPERRDLVMLRNQLVQYLTNGPKDMDAEQLTNIEEASQLLQQKLPEPVHHETACSRCPYLTICSLHLWHTDGPTVSDTHPLTKLREQALFHLSEAHIKYFLHWTALLKLEEKGQMVMSPLHSLWTDTAEKRAKRGTCAANLKLKNVKSSADRYLHVFQRPTEHSELLKSNNKVTRGPQEGDFSIVSVESRPWIAAGVVTLADENDIHILLERDLSRRLNENTLYHIDMYESYAATVQNLTNLGVLMEDSDRAQRLRKLIIDKESPYFETKLPREVGRLGTKLMRKLNIQQQRAVLRALAANDYALLQGLPGTGKTQTIVVLIQMLVGLKRRVLVTAHTHSAVDTVLSRLPESLRVMRLGSSGRVSAAVSHRTEERLTASCRTASQLAELYDSMEVVGVTCLGAAHAALTRTTFDVCIVDEATQVLQSTVLRPLFAAKRFLLVGDPEQLPPVVRSRAARRLGMEESLFHRLMRDEATSTLQLQYRMNRPLADVANTVAYNNRLKCADTSVANATVHVDAQKISDLYSVESPWMLRACSTDRQYAAVFIDTELMGHNTASNKSCANAEEASVVMALVEALMAGGVQSSDIGIIAPYRDQVSLLRRLLHVEVSTVDQFQGRDKSVIVYSCTKRDDGVGDKKAKEGEVLNDQRRLAVSVTRAKHKLLVVGDSRALRRYEPLQRLIDTCTKLTLEKHVVKQILDKYKDCF